VTNCFVVIDYQETVQLNITSLPLMTSSVKILLFFDTVLRSGVVVFCVIRHMLSGYVLIEFFEMFSISIKMAASSGVVLKQACFSLHTVVFNSALFTRRLVVIYHL
jgi:hypothetical protein